MAPRILAIGCLLSLAAPSWAGQPADLDLLVKKLGSDRFAEREAATRELDALGPTALAALDLAVQTGDLEIGRRATLLAQRIRDRQARSRLQKGLPLRMDPRPVSVAQAVAGVAQRSGNALLLDSDFAIDRKWTAPAQEMVFWDLLEHLCKDYGLGELLDDDDARLIPGKLVLVKTPPRPWPTHVQGAVRLRALPHEIQNLGKGDPAFALEVAVEPSLTWNGLSACRLTRVLDDQGQVLVHPEPQSAAPPVDPKTLILPIWTGRGWTFVPLMGYRSVVSLRLERGQKPARKLQLVEGIATLRVQVKDPVLVLEKALAAPGKAFSNLAGERLTVLEIEDKEEVGQVRLRVRVENYLRADDLASQVVRVRPGFVAWRGPVDLLAANLTLEDSDGRAWLLTSHTHQSGPENAVDCLLTFERPPQAGGSPRLVLSRSRITALDVPFTLKDIPLP